MSNRIRKYIISLILVLISALVLPFVYTSTVHAYEDTDGYTQEEIDAIKAWLSAHGYPPTRAGAEQAYQDYLDGKFDDNPDVKAYKGETDDDSDSGDGSSDGSGDGSDSGSNASQEDGNADTASAGDSLANSAKNDAGKMLSKVIDKEAEKKAELEKKNKFEADMKAGSSKLTIADIKQPTIIYEEKSSKNNTTLFIIVGAALVIIVVSIIMLTRDKSSS